MKIPRFGMRVRFTRRDHSALKQGSEGFIELIYGNSFWVLTDEGGLFGWTTFESWEPTGQPDEVLSPEFVEARKLGRP